jgi:Transposase IS66 family
MRQPQPAAEDVPKRSRRPKQSAAKNLLDDLLRRAEHVLANLVDLRIPFTNNQAERDLRMAKVQQKIAGTFRVLGWRNRFLSHSQLSHYHAQAGASHVGRAGGSLCWSTIAYRLGTWVVTEVSWHMMCLAISSRKMRTACNCITNTKCRERWQVL